MECIFCRRPVTSERIPSSYEIRYDCPSCGKYGMTEELSGDIAMIKDPDRRKISHLLAEHRLKNLNPLILAEGEVGSIPGYIWASYARLLTDYPKEPTEILDRTLMNLSRLISQPYQHINMTQDIKELFFTGDLAGVFYIIRQFADQKYTTLVTGMPSKITIEAEGWKRINELKNKPEGLQHQVFVAMWFDKSMDVVFEQGIKKAIEDASQLKVIRVDLKEHNNKICDEIIAEINKSSFLVADFTGDRGGVYFEAGYAQGRRIPVIWTVHQEWVNKLHFDTRQYNHIVYNDAKELYKKLKARMEATILNEL